MKKNMFMRHQSAKLRQILTSLVMLGLLLWFMLPLARWAVIDARWQGAVQDCHRGGACWVYVRENFTYLMYGLYPQVEQGRVNTLLVVMGLWGILVTKSQSTWGQVVLWVGMALIGPFVVYSVLEGSFWGMPVVVAPNWGGLTFNLLLSVLTVAVSLPLGCVIAIVRRQSWGVYSLLCRILIDSVRGLPLVSLFFFAALVMPFFLIDGQGLTKLMRLFCVFCIFGAAYMAEAVRGGLQSVDIGQSDAADVLGLSQWQKLVWVVFPQAMEAASPSICNIAIAILKDSTLISTVAVLDVVGIMQARTANMEWMPYAVEGYLFVGFAFWALCQIFATMGRAVESSLHVHR